MKKPQRAILELLREKSPDYGLELVKRSEGRLRRGTVYVHLRVLEDDDFVKSFTRAGEDLSMRGGRPRYWYELSGNGRKKLIDLESESGGFLGDLPEGSLA